MGDAVAQFGKVPTKMAMAGKLRGLRRSEYAVYLILAAHAYRNGLSTRPSVKTVAWETGFDERTVDRVLKRLREKELIFLTRQGCGRGNPSAYKLATNPGNPSVPLSDTQTPATQVPPFGDVNPGNPDRKPRQTNTETSANGDLNPGTWNAPRTEEQKNRGSR